MYSDMVGELDGPPELDVQLVAAIKNNCPLLTTVVDPSNYKWTFKTVDDGLMVSRRKSSEVVAREHPAKDLPTLEWDE